MKREARADRKAGAQLSMNYFNYIWINQLKEKVMLASSALCLSSISLMAISSCRGIFKRFSAKMQHSIRNVTHPASSKTHGILPAAAETNNPLMRCPVQTMREICDELWSG
jgi:hypothetical protein